MTLDSALQNSYAEHVLAWKSLTINYGTYITMQQKVVGDKFSVNVSRAASRLKTIFCPCNGDYSPLAAQHVAHAYDLVKKNLIPFTTLWGTGADSDPIIYDLSGSNLI